MLLLQKRSHYIKVTGLLAALLISPIIAADPTIDCPLRDAPFSLESPLIDVMLSEQASAIVNHHMDGALEKMPEHFASTQPPSFSAILNVRTLASMARFDPAKLPRVEQELSELKVSDSDRTARCARYDVTPPKLDVPTGKPRLLLFEKINGFKDVPSFNAAHRLLQDMAKREGWALASTDNGAVFNAKQLKQFDAVIWNNISGDVLTLSQRQAFRQYIEQGGGFVGIHGSGGDPTYFWDWYADELIGARFSGHPKDPQIQEARVVVENNHSGIGQGLPTEWNMNEEWYSFKTSPRDKGATIIATLDESTYNPVGHHGVDLRMGDHPIAWSRCINSGRSFYSAIGHNPEVYDDANHQKLLLQGILWATDQTDEQCSHKR
ncbi:ThuA domain-containing protein [Pseudomaricurvus sp.]|uniref:ThuA domain-containing protein n=1 Tax=Pseudomaricurvus sp. TaxID=2004510 RepID=UPI003F6B6AB1